MHGRYAQRRGRLRSPLPPNNGRDGRLLFFQTAGKFSTLVAPIVILTGADKRCEVVLISKKGCLRLDSIKNQRQEMRVEDGSGAVCCVQAEVFEFSCWESEGIHSFHPEHSRNGEKGTI